MSYIVVLRTGDRLEDLCFYGPFDLQSTAGDFAEYLTREVDPATAHRLDSPTVELLSFWRRVVKHGLGDVVDLPPTTPEHWPPRHGDTWQDKEGDRWISLRDGSMQCLAHTASASPLAISADRGPLTLVYRPDVTEDEVPF